MEFRNLTPFRALCFPALDPADREHRVVAMRVCYALEPGTPGGAPGWATARVVDVEPPPLVLADRHAGEAGRSSTLQESDLAPYKPCCDVLVRGAAHAPGGKPATRWTAGLRVSRPRRSEAEKDAVAVDLLVNKELSVCGPRTFRRTWSGGWELQPALPTASVPLRYERAFGGASEVRDPGSRPEDPPLLSEVCYQNPIGCGWQDGREMSLLARTGQPLPEHLPAPQLEAPGDPIKGMFVTEQQRGPLSPSQMLSLARREPHSPAGFGPLGRAWTPRLQRAGTYDDTWLRDRWPGLPADFDFEYWSCAPSDQKIPYPPPGLVIELVNLAPPSAAPGGYLAVQLPRHRPFVLVRLRSGAILPLPMLTDTVDIDTASLQIHLVHRISIPSKLDVRVLEARMEVNPEAPLVTLKKRGAMARSAGEAHG
ncbi:MAG: DUF2169 domain-containing protein [Polyangiaceae bacterium]